MKDSEEEIRAFFRDELVQGLPKGPQINIRCIFHTERSPSLSINLTAGVLKCHAGCGQGNFEQFKVRVKEKALKPDYSGVPLDMIEEIAALQPGGRQSIYPYVDETGTELFRVVRTDFVSGRKQFVCEARTGEGTYIPSLKGVRRVLFNLPDLLGAEMDIVCEGEKCVEALRALNLSTIAGCTVAATCNYGGAGKWQGEYNSCFVGKPVALLSDNDEAGRNHMIDVARALKPVAKEIKIGAMQSQCL